MGPTWKLSSLRLGTCQGQNYSTLASQTFATQLVFSKWRPIDQGKRSLALTCA